MILLLIAPYAIVFLCDQTGLDFSIGLWIYGALLAFNMVYAFLLPRLGFNGRQILFWNLLLKLWNIPLVLMILLVTLVTSLVGGEGIRDEAFSMVLIALLLCYLIQVSSAMFGYLNLPFNKQIFYFSFKLYKFIFIIIKRFYKN